MASRLRHDLQEYFRALFRQWKALVVGAAFTIGFGILPAVTDLTLPAWLWALSVTFAVIPASFLAWRDERRRFEQGVPPTTTRELAEVRRQLTELQDRLRPRLIPNSPTMIQRLMVESKGSINIWYVIGDPEPYSLAVELKHVLKAAGWTVDNFRSGIEGGQIRTGISIMVLNADQPPPRAAALKAILEEAGLATRLESDPRWGPDMVQVDVLSKPIF